MLDIVRSENDPTSLCNVFKHWLLDCSTDTEHLSLCLPACLGDTPIILKCDLQERLINPACLARAGEKFVSIGIHSFVSIGIHSFIHSKVKRG